jgi:transposase
MHFIGVLSRVNTVTFNDVTVDIDLSVYEKSSAVLTFVYVFRPLFHVIISLFEDGVNQRRIAEILGVSQSGASKFLKRFNQRESCEIERQNGRPRKTDDRGDGKILLCVKMDRRQSLTEITNKVNNVLPNTISSRTVRRRLQFHEFRRRKNRKTLTIRTENRHRHVHWCRSTLRWTLNRDWKTVIFSDETQVVVDSNNCVYVWRCPGEVWQPECLGLHGNCKCCAMFWGCITYQGVGTSTEVEGNINSRKYINILDTYLWPVIARHFPTDEYLFQDDNVPVHASRETKRWKQENDIKCMTWPSQSPDLNIIENVWRTIKIRLQSQITDIKNRTQLVANMKEIWTSLPQHLLHTEFICINSEKT